MDAIVLGLSLIDLAVLGGVAAVLPAALGGQWRWWAASAIALLGSLSLARGAWAAVLVAPWVITGMAVAIHAWRGAGPRRSWDLDATAALVAHGWGLVAAGAMVASRLGLTLFGVHEPIAQLTVVHYTYAGVGALMLAVAAHRTAESPRTRTFGRLAVLLTAAAPPMVALGFVTGGVLPQVGGAVLMTVGVWLTASLELTRVVRHQAAGWLRLLLGVSGLAVWVPMVLAVAWAAGQHWDVPILSIPDMARTHGVGNAVGFIACGLLARHLDRGAETTWS